MSQPQQSSQPWKDNWPPPLAAGVKNLNTFCTSIANKGAQPHETNYADGTNIIRPDNFQLFIADMKSDKAEQEVEQET